MKSVPRSKINKKNKNLEEYLLHTNKYDNIILYLCSIKHNWKNLFFAYTYLHAKNLIESLVIYSSDKYLWNGELISWLFLTGQLTHLQYCLKNGCPAGVLIV